MLRFLLLLRTPFIKGGLSCALMLRKCFHLLMSLPIALNICAFAVHAQTIPEEKPAADWIRLASPKEGTTTIRKKPVIECAISIPFTREGLAIMLDDTDVTALAEISGEGFRLKPFQVLSAGQHKLAVAYVSPAKKEYRREFNFAIRHAEAFEEFASVNDISIVGEQVVKKRLKEGDVDPTPYTKFEANINSASRIREQNFEASLTGNLRYLEQNAAVDPPIFKDFTVPNYLMTAKYRTEKAEVLAETGDVMVNETANTVEGLARRGLRLNAAYGDFRVSTFSVRSQQVSGTRELNDTGLQFNTEDRIEGASGEIDLLDKRVNFKTILVRGQTPGTDFGTFSSGGSSGDNTGFVLKTDFFSQKLKTELEYDVSNYDQDTSDAMPKKRDEAYRMLVGGQISNYTYEALYEHTGRDYGAIGSFGVMRDREGFLLKGGGRFEFQALNIQLSRYNDNVNNSELVPRIYTYQGTVDYIFEKFKSVPMGINCQFTRLESTGGPADITPKKTDSQNYSGRINFIKSVWNIGLNASYATLEDRYNPSDDNTNTTVALTPAFTTERFSVVPNLSLNKLKNDFTGIETETYTANVALRGNLLEKRIDYELAYVYNKADSTDDLTHTESTSVNFRTGYLLARQKFGFISPTVGVRGTYSMTRNRAQDTQQENYFIFVFISANMPISF